MLIYGDSDVCSASCFNYVVSIKTSFVIWHIYWKKKFNRSAGDPVRNEAFILLSDQLKCLLPVQPIWQTTLLLVWICALHQPSLLLPENIVFDLAPSVKTPRLTPSYYYEPAARRTYSTYEWRKLHVQLHKMWDKVEIKRNNGGIDELKAGRCDKQHIWNRAPLFDPSARSSASTTESLLLRSQLWAHLQHSAASHFVMSLWGPGTGSTWTALCCDRW